MTDTAQPGFSRVDVTAVAKGAADVRRDFSQWLQQQFLLDAVKLSDIVLAVNEALANAAEFAYATAQRAGVMHIHTDYDDDSSTLTVTVTDEGLWRRSESAAADSPRGRGIPLMHALSDRAVIDSTSAGTRVQLQWAGVQASAGVGSDAQNCGSRTT